MSSSIPTFILQVQKKDGELVRSFWSGGMLELYGVQLQTVKLENGARMWFSPDFDCNCMRVAEAHEITMTEVILPLMGLSLIEAI